MEKVIVKAEFSKGLVPFLEVYEMEAEYETELHESADILVEARAIIFEQAEKQFGRIESLKIKTIKVYDKGADYPECDGLLPTNLDTSS